MRVFFSRFLYLCRLIFFLRFLTTEDIELPFAEPGVASGVPHPGEAEVYGPSCMQVNVQVRTFPVPHLSNRHGPSPSDSIGLCLSLGKGPFDV
jgi:hypothetical protein